MMYIIFARTFLVYAVWIVIFFYFFALTKDLLVCISISLNMFDSSILANQHIVLGMDLSRHVVLSAHSNK